MMNSHLSLKARLMTFWNDQLDLVPYGPGYLAYLPWRYSDDDAVTLYIEETANGMFRITDQGTTIMRLRSFEQFDTGGALDEAWRQTLGQLRTHDFGTPERSEEISVFCASQDLAESVTAVASACLRAEQADLAASTGSKSPRFSSQVTQSLLRISSSLSNVKVSRRVTVPLRTGRTRTVTARLDHPGSPHLWVQAVGGRKLDERESQVAKCFLTFSQGVFDGGTRIAVLAGAPNNWPKGMAEDLKDVSSDVVFFDENERPLEAAIQSQFFPQLIG